MERVPQPSNIYLSQMERIMLVAALDFTKLSLEEEGTDGLDDEERADWHLYQAMFTVLRDRIITESV